MSKYPTYKESKRIEKFENQLQTSEMRIKNNKWQAENEKEEHSKIEKEYKDYLNEHGLNGYTRFKNLND